MVSGKATLARGGHDDFAEISMQLAERGDVKQTTDVMTLNA